VVRPAHAPIVAWYHAATLSKKIETYDAIVIGGGAAGMMCAIEAGKRGRRVVLIEHNDTVGKKIRISGGGRCNFTNLHCEPGRYISRNPRFCHSALARYTPGDFVQFVDGHQIPYHEKKLGQLFCNGSAQAIIDALVSDCVAAGVEIRVGCSVGSVERSDTFLVQTSRETLRASALVIATGGLSIPKLGASDFGYRVAAQFDLPVVPCAPGLVPLTLCERDMNDLSGLSGTSFDAEVTCNKITFDESVLITHRGLSGPAILQISSYWEPDSVVKIDLFPELALTQTLLKAKKDFPNAFAVEFLTTQLTSRFAQRLCEVHHWKRPFGEFTDAALRDMAAALQAWRVTPAGTEGYAKAEVTRGGVDTKALSPKTMEARDVPGLFIIGEVMDVTGWLGGYNFQWAWSSGFAAGNAL